MDGFHPATPAETHFTIAREALLSGKHVYVEKPLVLDEACGEVLISLAGKTLENVSATGGYYLHKNIADVTTTHLTFPSGLQAHIFVSWLHPFKEQKLVVFGDQKIAVFDDTQMCSPGRTSARGAKSRRCWSAEYGKSVMIRTTSPHDKLIKKFLSNRETAASFFDHYLPPDIRETVNLETLEICKDSFVEPDLREFFSDMLYKARFGERSGYLYMLLEHKSHPEKHTALQVLGYIRGIWTLHLKQAAQQPLPVIVPLVLHHGPRPWPYSTDLLSLMDGPDKRFLPYIPDFSFVLVDLFRFSDKDIKGAVLCRVSLLLLKHVFTPGYEDKIPAILSLLKTLLEKQTGLQYIETVIRYILTTAENMSAENLKQIVEEKLSAEQGALTMTIADRIRKEGMNEGIQLGEKRLLSRLIARKYGLSQKVVDAYLEKQSPEALLELGDRILEWDSFEQVKAWVQGE